MDEYTNSVGKKGVFLNFKLFVLREASNTAS